MGAPHARRCAGTRKPRSPWGDRGSGRRSRNPRLRARLAHSRIAARSAEWSDSLWALAFASSSFQSFAGNRTDRGIVGPIPGH